MLSQHLSANVEAKVRFADEARTISRLNHPHICALYDVGREKATDYLVMELLEAETLAAVFVAVAGADHRVQRGDRPRSRRSGGSSRSSRPPTARDSCPYGMSS